MHLLTDAIVCAVRPHGEHGAVVRALTPADGLVAGYVRGGRSRRLRPILIPGNVVRTDFRARTEEQLAALTVELVHSRAPLLTEPLAAAAIEWATSLAAAVLPEAQPYPRVHAALDGLLDAIEAAPSARGWAGALIRYELLVQADLGYADDYAAILPPRDADWQTLLAALKRNTDALGRHLFADRRAWALDARERLLARLARLA